MIAYFSNLIGALQASKARPVALADLFAFEKFAPAASNDTQILFAGGEW
jgi:hypothetical protein